MRKLIAIWIYSGIIIFLTFSWNSVWSQTYTKSTQLEISHAELNPDETKTMYTRSSNSGLSFQGCQAQLTDCDMYLRLTNGDNYNYGSNQFSYDISVTVSIYNDYTQSGSSNLLGTYTRTMSITQTSPEQLIKTDISNLIGPSKRIVVTATMLDNGYLCGSLDSVKLEAYYEETYHRGNFIIFPTLNAVSGANPVTFSWNFICPDAKNYEIQVLRLYNKSLLTADDETEITTDVDWDEAMSIETGSAEKNISLTLAEGSGYYVWRVRAIGDMYEGGISDPRNWGPWSGSGQFTDGATDLEVTAGINHYLFYYTQFDDSLNFIYSRVFTEGDPDGGSQVRISEQMTYANGLQQVRQQQAMVQSEGKLIVNQMLLDYAGRPALTTLGVPVTQDHLGYLENFVTNSSGNLYTAADFDVNTYLRNPQKIDSLSSPLAEYYSDMNSDLSIPSANGYPFSRVIYYGDGTGRPREQSGPGYSHRISSENDRHTTRIYYSSPADIELVRVLGDEAPQSSKAFKTLTTDPNGSSSVSYVNEQGQTIITCLVVPPIGYNRLDTLPGASQAAFNVSDTIDQADAMGEQGYTTMKRYVFTDPVGFGIRYNLEGDGFGDACVDLCHSCDYSVNIRIMEVRDTLYEIYDTTIRNIPDYGACYSGDDVPSMIDSIQLSPGEYIVQKEVYLYNTAADTNLTYLDLFVDSVETTVRKEIKTELEDMLRFLENHDMDSLLLVYEDHIQDSVIRIPLAGVCDTVEIPLILCDTSDCNNRDFALLIDSLYSDNATYSGLDGNNNINAFLIGGNQYTHAEFNSMIENMKTDGYDCDSLWLCWYGAVAGLEDLDDMMEDADLGNPNLLESFIECAGTQYADTTNNYEKFKDNPYQYVYYPATLQSDICEDEIFGGNIAATLTASNAEEKDSLLRLFYSCIHNQTDQMPQLPSGSTFNIFSVHDTIENYCEATCESRMPQFISTLVNYYHEQGRYVEGDKYALIPDLGDSSGYVVSNTPIDIDTVDDGYEKTDSIYCLALKALDYCKQGCELTIDGSCSTTINSVGTESEYNAMMASMFYNWEFTLPDSTDPDGNRYCRPGYTTLDSIGYNLDMELLLLNRELYLLRQTLPDTLQTTLSGILSNSSWEYITDRCSGNLTDPTFIIHPDSALYFRLVCGSNAKDTAIEENDSIRIMRISPEVIYEGMEFEVEVVVDFLDTIHDFTLQEYPDNTYFSLINGNTTLCRTDSLPGRYSFTYTMRLDNPATSNYPFVTGLFSYRGRSQSSLTSYIDAASKLTCCTLRLINNYYTVANQKNRIICDCFQEITPSCGDLCVKRTPFEMPDTADAVDFNPISCEDYACNYMLGQLNLEIERIASEHGTAVAQMYHDSCFLGALDEEDYVLNYNLKYYHYTLYYYDRAGNLVRTVPPAGVSTSATNRMQHPAHDLVTEYEYNSLKQLVRQKTPDGGESRFWYDFAGRLRFSQNAKQELIDAWSYTIYDDLSRIIEVGQAYGLDTLEINNQDYPVGTLTIEQRTLTTYSTPMPGVTYYGQAPRYLQNRVSYSMTDHDGDLQTTADQTYTYYSYDPHGNVEWLVQEQTVSGRNYIGYEYDLLSGSVLKVKYNEMDEDRFFHRYSYDADKRITVAETSTDGEIWDRDARYDYYLHGPLKRTVIGEDEVQGVDYTYTIQGWLKGINYGDLNPSRDPGHDGSTGSRTGQDLFGMVLSYYAGDFIRSNGGNQSPFNTNNYFYHLQGTSLYNGNISSWTESTVPFQDEQYPGFTGHTYRYDQLNRLKDANFMTNCKAPWNDPGDYFDESYTYDGNGNIETLSRTAYGLELDMDNMTYHYYSNNNQLAYVSDKARSDGNLFDDITDQTDTNYFYDATGNLTKDVAEGIDSIIWNVYGKIDTIYKAGGDTLIFAYDATGNRVRKQLRPGTYNPTGYDNTFYVRDAQGNIMATYDLVITEATNDYDAALILSEQPIYGSDRIGVRNPDLTVYSSKVNPANLWTRPDEEVYLATDSILLFPLQNAPSTGSGTVIHSGNPIVHYITAQFAHAAEGVFDMRYNQNSLTIPYNSRIGFSTQNTAVALNDCGNIELYATVNHDAYQLMSDTVYNKLKLFGRNRNLINPGTVINADNKSQSAFTRVPGSENRWYYITLSEGKVWLHTIDATAGTVENANLDLDPSNSNYGRTLALVEDNTGAGSGMLYVRRYNNTTKKTELVGFAINETGMGAPVVLAEFSSKDVSGDGEIQLSPDASRLAVANKTCKSFLWFNLVTGSDVRLFDVNATHNALSNATTVLSANYVYYQSLDFTESGDYLYVMKQTGNSTTPVRYNIITPGSVNLSSVTGGGDIRRGTEGNMYVATNKKMYYISSPETATSANAMSSWNNAYNMTQSLPAQPVRMGIYSIPCGGTYARVMNQKQYELKDHLGNVRVTFSDLKQPQDCDLLADGYVATAMSVNNYYSFGMLQPGRNWNAGNYRYSYNGKEQVNEIKGTGNSLDFGARIYDPRLGRWLSVDPLQKKYPNLSPYNFCGNSPIVFKDHDGKDFFIEITENTIIIRATYHTDNSYATKEIVDRATSYINSFSDKYKFVTEEGKEYNIKFELTTATDDISDYFKNKNAADNDNGANFVTSNSFPLFLERKNNEWFMVYGICEEGGDYLQISDRDLANEEQKSEAMKSSKCDNFDMFMNNCEIEEILHSLGASHDALSRFANPQMPITKEVVMGILLTASESNPNIVFNIAESSSFYSINNLVNNEDKVKTDTNVEEKMELSGTIEEIK